MGITTVFKVSVLSAFMVFLTACSDSDEVFTGPGAVNEVGASESTGPTDVSNSDETTSNARPQFLTSDCGSLATTDAVPSNERSAPTTIAAEQLVSGRIAPDSESNYEHFWSIALQPGSYNVVFDSETVAGDYKYLNIIMTDFKGLGSDDDEVLIKFAETNYRARYHKFIEVQEARTLNLVITASDRAHDYRFAIFENGNPVPSPLFSDCPTIERLSLETTEALSLPAKSSYEEDRWYLVDLEAKDYVLNSQAASTNCDTGGIDFEISHVDQFGQKSRMQDHDRIKQEAGSTSLKSVEVGPVWIRIQNLDCAMNLEFTLNAES